MLKKNLFKLVSKVLPKKSFIRLKYYIRTGRTLNLKTPVLYNEKLQWLKFHWYDEEVITCVDKFRVREYVSKRIGEQYLSKLFAVYTSGQGFSSDKLPDKYVIKANHASGYNLIVDDKKKHSDEEIALLIDYWLSENYSNNNGEWAYSEVKPLVICEEFLKQENDEELRDYRFMCFDGEPKFIMVDLSINDKKRVRRNIFDLEWNLLEVDIHWPRETNIELKKPSNLEEMIEISRKLAKGFPHVRIDLYNISGRIIFGEMTFWHQSGMGKISPRSFEEKMGAWITLPQCKVENN